HCPHFSERDITRQIFKAAIGRYDDLACIDILQRATNAVGQIAGVSTVISARSKTPSMTVFEDSAASTLQSRCDCAVSIEICFTSAASSSGRNE
ncbi:MAG: hypothetical protein WBX95_08550, partial [Xanthobacteraceae bacterium]